MLSKTYTNDTAIRLAYVAMAAYHSFDEESQMYQYLNQSKIPLKMIGQFTNPDSEINGFVCCLKNNSKVIIIGFTGTEIGKFQTIEEDLAEKLMPFNATGGLVSNGFLRAWHSVKTMVQSYIPNDSSEIWLVGHSLGAAIATLASADFRTIWNTSSSMAIITYTFASPRVGNREFVKEYNEMQIYSNRVQNYWDIVPRLPTKNIQGYEHVKTLILLKKEEKEEKTSCVYNASIPTNTLYDIFDWFYEHHLSTYLSLIQSCIKCNTH